MPMCTCFKCQGKQSHPGDQSNGRQKVHHCASKKSKSNVKIPIVCIGKYRKFLVCKKNHLVLKEELSQLISRIDEELSVLDQKGDIALDVLEKSDSESEFTYDKESETSTENNDEKTKTCDGYTDLEKSTKCCTETSGFLYFEDKAETKYFCKGTHIVRYILQHYCKQGKSSGGKKKK